MARPNKTGFDYFSFDCSFFDDIKTRKLIRKCGAEAIPVYIAILCLIYKDGYYLKLDEDMIFVISEKAGVSEDSCKSFIEQFAEFGLIDKKMFEQGIVTSHGIQKRYMTISQQSKRVSVVDEYALIVSSEETRNQKSKRRISSEETHYEEHNSEVSSVAMQQRKEKKSKENKNNSSLSSFQSDTEEIISEEEKEKILFEFVFEKNLASPGRELELFLDYNNSDGRSWSTMTQARKEKAIRCWKQEPKQEPRFKPDFLAMWREVYMTIKSLGASKEILFDMLSDNVSVGYDRKFVVIYCSEAVARCIENEAVIMKVRPAIMKYVYANKREFVRYDYSHDTH